jgi:cytochrome oxidase Cu insertion factor (SCO1/SenC/PrrC family)
MFKNSILTCFIALLFNPVWANVPENDFKEEVNIYKQVYNASFLTTKGENISLLQLTSKKPVILAMIFTRCSNICYPFLLRLKEDLQFDHPAGNFTVAVVSFDPRDSREDMRKMARGFGLENEPGWIFGTTKDIDSLNQSIGFEVAWDELRGQFDHDALLIGLNGDGYIVKKLIGIRNKSDLNLLVGSINNVFTASYRLPGQNLLFSCFNYDPKTGKTKPGTGLLFLVLPAVLAVSLLIGIRFAVGKRE